MAIYLQLPEGLTFNNIEELLIWGYDNGDKYCFVETFTNVECTEKECHSARRSFEDLMQICQTYFSATTERELAKTIYKLRNYSSKKNGKTDHHVRPMWCNNIEKVVFTFDSVGWHDTWLEHPKTVNGRNNNGEGKYCYNDIMYLLIDFPQ